MKRPASEKKYSWQNPKLSQEERSALWNAERERLDRSLFRKIEAWARIFEHCPVAGCRRNERCLHRDKCRVPETQMSPEEEEALWRDFRRQLRAALAGDRGEPAPPAADDPELSPQVRAWMASDGPSG